LPPGFVVHPAGDEALDPAVGIDDPERGVLGADEGTHSIDDDLQDVVDGDEAGDPPDGRVEGGVNLALAGLDGCLRVEHLRRG